jgi:hypothetical protein
MEWGEKIPLGVFYEEQRQTSEDREHALQQGILTASPLGIPDRDELLKLFR